MELERKLDYLFEEIYNKKDLEEFYIEVLSHMKPTKASVKEILDAIGIFIKITGPKNLGDFYTIINPNTGFVDLKTAKIMYLLLQKLEESFDRETIEQEINKLF